MNNEQKRMLLAVSDKLTMIGYAFGQEIMDSAETIDSAIAYDLAATLQDIEAEVLTIPHKE